MLVKGYFSISSHRNISSNVSHSLQNATHSSAASIICNGIVWRVILYSLNRVSDGSSDLAQRPTIAAIHPMTSHRIFCPVPRLIHFLGDMLPSYLRGVCVFLKRSSDNLRSFVGFCSASISPHLIHICIHQFFMMGAMMITPVPSDSSNHFAMNRLIMCRCLRNDKTCTPRSIRSCETGFNCDPSPSSSK